MPKTINRILMKQYLCEKVIFNTMCSKILKLQPQSAVLSIGLDRFTMPVFLWLLPNFQYCPVYNLLHRKRELKTHLGSLQRQICSCAQGRYGRYVMWVRIRTQTLLRDWCNSFIELALHLKAKRKFRKSCGTERLGWQWGGVRNFQSLCSGIGFVLKVSTSCDALVPFNFLKTLGCSVFIFDIDKIAPLFLFSFFFLPSNLK